MTAPNAWKVGTGNPFADHTVTLPEPADHRAWLLQRREGIGSSDCAAVLGMDKYDTPYSLWLDKTGRIPLSEIDSEPAEWGRLLEPVIRDQAAARLGMDYMLIGGLASKAHAWQRASLDAVIFDDTGEPGVLEVKNTSQYLASEWADDQVPDRAELQVQHSMAVTGARFAYVAGLVGGNKLMVRRVERDQELIDHITAEERDFWRHVLGDTQPPIVARDSLSAIVAAAGTPDDDTLVLDPTEAATAREWLAEYDRATRDEKDAQQRKAAARNNLAAIAEGHSRVVAITGDVEHDLFRLQRGVFAARKFENEFPDVADLYRKKVEVIDTAALKNEDPDMYRRFQSVSVRIPKGTS